MNESEPLMRCRNVINVFKTKLLTSAWDKFRVISADCLIGNRHEGGMTLKQALVWNMRTCHFDVKGEVQVAETIRTRVPMRSTGADQFVVAMILGNASGAKGLNCSAKLIDQPILGGIN